MDEWIHGCIPRRYYLDVTICFIISSLPVNYKIVHTSSLLLCRYVKKGSVFNSTLKGKYSVLLSCLLDGWMDPWVHGYIPRRYYLDVTLCYIFSLSVKYH